jgi:hypothetical protein
MILHAKAFIESERNLFGIRQLILNMGNLVRLWLDPWMNGISLCSAYPMFLNISLAQDVTFEHVMRSKFKIPYRRCMLPDMLI